MSEALPDDPITFAEFMRELVRVPNERTKVLEPVVCHAEQRRFIAAVDTRDPDTDLRRYREFIVSWIKKAGKSTSAGALAVWALFFDELANDREVLICSSDEDQSHVIFNAARNIIRREPSLRDSIRETRTELIFVEPANPNRIQSYKQDHVLRALPRDVRGLHGSNASCTIIDEVWTQDDFELFESLAPSPARQSPITAYFSYAGLKSQRHDGNPWFEILKRGEAGDDPTLFYSRLSGPDAWRSIPWITSQWVESMRRQFSAVPSKFRRLVYNEWSTSDSAFLTSEEIHDAIDVAAKEPERGLPGVRYSVGVDIGLTRDWSAVVITHLDQRSRVVIDVVRYWRGTKTNPVRLSQVEDEIVTLSQRFDFQRGLVDQWQAAYLLERLRQRGLSMFRTLTIEPVQLDKMATELKAAFAERLIRIPAREKELIEQLETLEGAETGQRNRRRDRLRFTSGVGVGAAAHDDIAVAMTLALQAQAGAVGRPRLEEQDGCAYEQSVGHSGGVDCYLWGGAYTGWQRQCTDCPGNISARGFQEQHQAETGEYIEPALFVATMVRPNQFVLRRRLSDEVYRLLG